MSRVGLQVAPRQFIVHPLSTMPKPSQGLNLSQGIYYFSSVSRFPIRHVTGVYESICLIKALDESILMDIMSLYKVFLG